MPARSGCAPAGKARRGPSGVDASSVRSVRLLGCRVQLPLDDALGGFGRLSAREFEEAAFEESEGASYGVGSLHSSVDFDDPLV